MFLGHKGCTLDNILVVMQVAIPQYRTCIRIPFQKSYGYRLASEHLINPVYTHNKMKCDQFHWRHHGDGRGRSAYANVQLLGKIFEIDRENPGFLRKLPPFKIVATPLRFVFEEQDGLGWGKEGLFSKFASKRKHVHIFSKHLLHCTRILFIEDEQHMSIFCIENLSSDI
jgi:hypothetical protein